jgi:type VI protein secretion system component Hcp
MLKIIDLNRNEELSSADMGKVAGGTDNSPVVHASTPNLFSACCNGKHFNEATITL